MAGGWLRGETILPELIKRERDEYCQHLQIAHDSFAATGTPDLNPLHGLVTRLLDEQLATVPATPPEVTPDSAPAEPVTATPTAPTACAAGYVQQRKVGEVQLRYTLRNQAEGRFCVWDNVVDKPAVVDLEYEKAWSEAEHLNGMHDATG